MTNLMNIPCEHVEKFVEKNVKKWKKVENYSYFCGR